MAAQGVCGRGVRAEANCCSACVPQLCGVMLQDEDVAYRPPDQIRTSRDVLWALGSPDGEA